MMNLDLENPTPFWKVISENPQGRQQVLDLCKENEPLVSSISAYSELPKVLNDALTTFVSSAVERIKYVTAYHGCRVFNESDYTERGIRKLETDRIVKWCKEFFGLDDRIEGILSELGEGYIRHGESGVFCMRGIEAAKKNECSHCDGSELVRCITNRLGKNVEERYFAAGTPCFIEVCTPIEWFKKFSNTSLESLLRDIFTHWLWVELELDWPGDPREGGIVFQNDIPPEFIMAFHYTERTQPNEGANGIHRTTS